MNKQIKTIALLGALTISLILTGCGGNGLADYNEKVGTMTGTGAGKISLTQTSNVHSISLDLIGGKVTQSENGDNQVHFENIIYAQANPIWNTKIVVEDYVRIIPAGEGALPIVEDPISNESDLVRARGDAPLIEAGIE